jgi:hypothetical protein
MTSKLDGYLSRMTPDSVWPAAHSAGEAREQIGRVRNSTHLVLRWASNGQVPHDDMLAAWLVLGIITRGQADASSQQRAIEAAEFLAAYRNEAPEPDAEQLREMRAAFGPGQRVVNVATGREYQL